MTTLSFLSKLSLEVRESVATIFLLFLSIIISVYIFAGFIAILLLFGGGIVAIIQNKPIMPFVLDITTQTISILQIIMDFVAQLLILIIIILMLIWNFVASFINNFHTIIYIPLFNVTTFQQTNIILVEQILDYPFQFYLHILGGLA